MDSHGVQLHSLAGRAKLCPIRLVLAAMLLLGWVTAAVAQTRAVTSDGLIMSVGSSNPPAVEGGYLPVAIQVTNTTANSRELRFLIESRIFRMNQQVSQRLELGPGSKADFTLSVPLTGEYLSGSLRVYERGRELTGLRCFAVANVGMWGRQMIPCIGIITRSTPDLRILTAAVGQVTVGQAIAMGSFQPTLMKPPEAPLKWIDYTMFDVVMVSIEELGELSDPARDALAAWAFAGGNLLVYGLGDSREKSPELNRLLDLDQRVPRGVSWRLPKPADRNTEPEVGANPSMRKQKGDGEPAAGTEQTAKPDRPFPAHFAVRPFGWGQLVASSEADPFPGVLEDWGWLIKTLPVSRFQWQTRHGISPRTENDDFWNFLIPGVGRAPVGGFQVLITLFALVIGPVNYFVLRRRRQLHLLLATVPVLALATTLLLLGYAIAADGFALRMRTRSVTLLDQVRGESASWSRISYYAGLAPRGGMRFSPHTAVYPITPRTSGAEWRTVDWTDGQRLPAGWLRSRTPTQFLTITHRQSAEQLAVATSTAGTVRVTNNLGVSIKQLFLADEEGRTYRAAELGRDESAKLEPSDRSTVQNRLRAVLDEQPLETPAEIARRAQNYGYSFFGMRRIFWGRSEVASWSDSLLERMLQDLAAPESTSARSVLLPRTYIAVTDQPPMVEVGVAESKDEGSLFIIIGMF